MPKAMYSRDTKSRQKGRTVAPSKMSAKQRAQRNGRQLKKGELAETANFVTRTQAVKRLQVSLRDFRRLCIFKGIYPRQPPKTPKGSATSQTYYHVKDIGFLAHEPVMHKFREMKAFMKKVRRAAGKGQLSEARRLAAGRPVYRIDHLIRERYPRFVDALADIDDALCMVHLFANLPADKPIEAERIATATRLVREWQHIVVRSRALRKCFISVKGYYYQASFLGVPVTWTAPHRFSLPIPDDVDCRILLTFLELYEVQLKFVLFKLYGDHGLAYPPRLDAEADDLGVMLSAVRSSRVDASAAAAADTAATAEDAESSDVAESQEDNDDEEGDSNSDEDEEGDGAGKRTRRAGAQDASETDARAANIARAGLGAVLREAAASGGMDGMKVMNSAAGRPSSSSRADDDEDSIAGSVDSLGGDEALDDEEVEAMADVMDAEQDHDEDEEDAASAGPGGAAAAAEAAAERRRAAALRERRGRRLFKGLTIFLNREVPREPFEFVVRAFAGRLGWEGAGSPIDASDESITHHVIDRPTVRTRIAGRVYVQPQWVFDSSNTRLLLPTERYAPGVSLPPHLSPFVEDEQEGYIPDYRKELMKLKSAVEVREDGDVAAAAAILAAGSDDSDDEDYTGAAAEGPESDDSDEEEDDEEAEAQAAAVALAKSGFLGGGEEDDDADDSEADDDEELEGDSSDEEEEDAPKPSKAKASKKGKSKTSESSSSASDAVATSASTSKAAKARSRRANARSKAVKQDKKEQDSLEMRAMLLSNKKRKELSLVMRGQRKSKQWQRKMEAKRDSIAAKAEDSKKGGKGGKRSRE